MLRNYLRFSMRTQAKLVCASMAIHNFIERRCPDEEVFDKVNLGNDTYVLKIWRIRIHSKK